ncbi:MAG: aspartate aminotransferase family protein [Actinomycetota bacterium]|nr:aspartate aminotransferase family protein [Actinomycetota bacterium]MDA2971186.1 aspartate aminotransferase family protein [Actinomycetota bacterium]MDA3001072.1 aspartate aminotransferase family protein [Actinomycetota bacterium]
MDRERLATRHREEFDLFARTHPRSAEITGSARRHLVAGVPMPWMTRWPGGFPVFVDHASGARFVDVDGHEYVDFCMGDTGAMAGHALPAVTDALAERARRGITTMLPSEDAVWVADELRRRFGLDKWQIAMTATDANRFVLRLARAITGRPKIAVIDWCYHGTVDETLVIRGADGRTMHRPGAIGPSADVEVTTRVVPFNDLEALDAALAHGDVACLLMEPALTNIGIVLPDPGYLDRVREVTRRHGVLWVVDETHTICAGPGGCTKAWGLDPDFFVIGKPIGGGMPVAVYGMTDEVADRVESLIGDHLVDVSGIGGTLTGNALALAAVRATLSTTLLEDDFARMIDLATSWTKGVESAFRARRLDWHVQQLGARAEYWFCPPPRNGADAAAASDHELDAYMHLFALNRGVLLTPFHNMALMSPAHRSADVDRHTEVFVESLASLLD